MFATNLHFKTTHVSAKVKKGCYKLIVQQPDALLELIMLGAQQYVELVLVHKGSAAGFNNVHNSIVLGQCKFMFALFNIQATR
jgi:hypothetical protein